MKLKATEFITGIIISGGIIRKENDKSAIEINDEVSIRTLYNLIQLFCSEVIISANCPKVARNLNETIVEDEIEGIGPIGTILSVLKKSSSQKNLILNWDMPLVPAGLLLLLIEKKDVAQLVIPASGKSAIEPLCAIYDKSVIPIITEMIQQGDYNIYNLPKYCRTELIQVFNGNNIFKNRSINHPHIENR